jgi:hypothetical protein
LAAAVRHDDIMILVLDASRLLPNDSERMVKGFTPLENPAHYYGDNINQDEIPLRKDDVKASPFRTEFTR